MASRPLVSIVVPAYNYAHYLSEAVDSVLNQDYPNVELIVLDDGSTDNTRAVLKGYGDCFYWETHENMGEVNTLNKGWRMARGEILAKLSADDVLLPNAVSACVEHLLADPDAVLVYGAFEMVGANSSIIRRMNFSGLSYRDMVAKLVNPVGPGAFFRRGAYEAAGPWNNSLRLTHDYEYWIRLGLQGTFLTVPKVLALFRVHGESQTFTEADEQKSDEYICIMSDYFKLQQVPKEIFEVKREALSNAYVFSARSHMRSKRFRMGLSRLLKALLLEPENVLLRASRILLRGLFTYIRYREHIRQKRPGARP